VYNPETEEITFPDGQIIPYKRQTSKKKTDSKKDKKIGPKEMRGDDPICEVLTIAAESLGTMAPMIYNDGVGSLDNTFPSAGGPWARAFNSSGRVWVNLGGI